MKNTTDRNHSGIENPIEVVILACQNLLQRDSELINNNSSERSITHMLATHLARYVKEFSGNEDMYNVDCEYNRADRDVKMLPRSWGELSQRGRGRVVLPDIVVHERRTNENNLIVIEGKKSTNSEGCTKDIARICNFMEHFNYQRGAMAVFYKENRTMPARINLGVFFGSRNPGGELIITQGTFLITANKIRPMAKHDWRISESQYDLPEGLSVSHLSEHEHFFITDGNESKIDLLTRGYFR